MTARGGWRPWRHLASSLFLLLSLSYLLLLPTDVTATHGGLSKRKSKKGKLSSQRHPPEPEWFGPMSENHRKKLWNRLKWISNGKLQEHHGDYAATGPSSQATSTTAPWTPVPLTSPPIYHGGPVMNETLTVHLIYYGKHTDSTKRIIADFVRGIGGTPWWGTVDLYYQKDGKGQVSYTTDKVVLGNIWEDPTMRLGKALSTNKIVNLVAQTLAANPSHIPDPNAVYYVLLSPAAKLKGFCSQFCGYHSHFGYKGVQIKYAVTGSVGGCKKCTPLSSSIAPNGDVNGDGIVSVMAHELAEAATNPVPESWYNVKGEENADMCAWKFSPVQRREDGKVFNVKWGDSYYLIQQNVRLSDNACALSGA